MNLIERLIIERAFGKTAAEKYEHGRLSEHMLASASRAAATLSLRFTGREEFGRGYLKDDAFRLGYLLYYLPSNIPKAGSLLNELAAHPADILKTDKIRILDLGAGQGAAALGILERFMKEPAYPRHYEIDAVDLNKQPLEDYRWLIGSYLKECSESRNFSFTVETHHADLERGLPEKASGKYDLIVAANLINEMFRSDKNAIERRAEWLAESITPSLAERGSIFVIEPALRDASRGLQHIRDLLSNRYGLTIYSPCTGDGDCPMLKAADKNWCHSAIDWKRPGIVAQLDKMIGSRKEMLKFSYLIVRRDGCKLSDAVKSGADSIWRIVSDPHQEKGKESVYGCGEGKYLPLVRLKRAASKSNKDFGALERGQIAALNGAAEREREIRIEEETEIESFGPFFYST